jgi:hypothetical protein
VTDPAQGSDDSTLISLLTNAGHTVTNAGASTGGAPTTTGQDIVIVSRPGSSGSYANNAGEVQGWVEIDKPMLVLNPYLFRNSRWGYINSGSL